MRTREYVIGCIAHCQGCDAIYEDYTKAQRQARNHHLKTGHTINVERVSTYQYKNDSGQGGQESE